MGAGGMWARRETAGRRCKRSVTRRNVVVLTASVLVGMAPLPAGCPAAAQGTSPASAVSEGERLLEAGDYPAAEAALLEELHAQEEASPTTGSRETAAALRSSLMLCAFHQDDLAAARRWEDSVIPVINKTPTLHILHYNAS